MWLRGALKLLRLLLLHLFALLRSLLVEGLEETLDQGVNGRVTLLQSTQRVDALSWLQRKYLLCGCLRDLLEFWRGHLSLASSRNVCHNCLNRIDRRCSWLAGSGIALRRATLWWCAAWRASWGPSWGSSRAWLSTRATRSLAGLGHLLAKAGSFQLLLSLLAFLGYELDLGGVPVFASPANNLLGAWAASSDNDRVLVIVQLHGGNDGLNTVIPLNNYGMYYNMRPNIAIPQNGARKLIKLDDTLEDVRKVGLHTDMTGAKTMYDQGKMAVVQNVAYANLNGSHFRSRDVWFMGGNYDEYLSSGWMGRYLEYYYPNYPDAYPNAQMPDPLALEK